MPITILAFAASNHSNSINRKLVEHAARVFKADVLPDAVIETLDLNDFEMPIYSQAREKERAAFQLRLDNSTTKLGQQMVC